LGKIQNGSLLLIQLYLISAMISKEEFEKWNILNINMKPNMEAKASFL
jgi:hypothetical protein